MKRTKIYIVFIVCMMILSNVTVVFSAVASSSIVTTVNFEDCSMLDFSFVLKRIGDDSSTPLPSNIEWDPDIIKLDSNEDRWYNANVYAEIKSNIRSLNAKVYMYTANHASSIYNLEENAWSDGLIRTDGKKNIPMIFMSTSTKFTDITDERWVQTVITNGNWSTPSDNNSRFLSDAGYGIFQEGYNYSKVHKMANLIADYRGIICKNWDEGTSNESVSVFKNNIDNDGKTTGRIYFSGKFNKVFGGEEYITDKLIIELVIDGD